MNHVVRPTPTGNCFALLVDRFLTSEEGHDREHNRNHKSQSYGPKRDLLASCCRPAAGNNVFRLERSRLRLLISARYREPSLGCAQIITAQHKALVLTFAFPLDGACKQTGMGTDPIKIGVQRVDQRVSRFFKIVALAKEDIV